MVLFKQGTKIMAQVNPKKAENLTVSINVAENMSSTPGLCQMNNGNVFYCCGNNGAVNNFAYFVNTSQKTVQKLANSPVAKYCIGPCVQYKNNIYVFGGHNGSVVIPNSERFEISSNK